MTKSFFMKAMSNLVYVLVGLPVVALVFQNCSQVDFSAAKSTNNSSVSTTSCDPSTYGTQNNTQDGTNDAETCTCTAAGTTSCSVTGCADSGDTLVNGVCVGPVSISVLINNSISTTIFPSTTPVTVNIAGTNVTGLNTNESVITYVSGRCLTKTLTPTSLGMGETNLIIGQQPFTYTNSLAEQIAGCTWQIAAVADTGKSAAATFVAGCTANSKPSNPICTLNGQSGNLICDADGLAYTCVTTTPAPVSTATPFPTNPTATPFPVFTPNPTATPIATSTPAPTAPPVVPPVATATPIFSTPVPSTPMPIAPTATPVPVATPVTCTSPSNSAKIQYNQWSLSNASYVSQYNHLTNAEWTINPQVIYPACTSDPYLWIHVLGTSSSSSPKYKVNPGCQVQFESHVMVESWYDSGTLQAVIQWYNSSGALIGTSTPKSLTSITANYAWAQCSAADVTGTAPSGAASAQLVIQAINLKGNLGDDGAGGIGTTTMYLTPFTVSGIAGQQ